MMRRPRLALTVLSAAAFLGLAACGSSPAVRYHALTPLPQPRESTTIGAADRRGIIAVGPVELADYLDRPQIVRRSGLTAVSPLELDRWAGSLHSDVTRVLVGNLAGLLAPDGYLVVPWEEAARPDGRVEVSVDRFEGTDQETVVLDARWLLKGRERGEMLAVGNAVIVEPVRGGGTGATVEAMSRALAGLSRRIAEAVPAAPFGER